VTWFIDRELSTRAMLAFYLSVTILLLTTVFSRTLFPVCFVEGRGLTLFKIASEYHWHQSTRRDDKYRHRSLSQ